MNNPLIIDCHLHIGKVGGLYSAGHSADDLIRRMDELHIQKGCISALYAITAGDAPRGNEEVADAVRRYPDRYIGMLCVNPHYPNEVRQQIEQHMPTGLFRQFKLHPQQQGAFADHPNFDPVYEYASGNGLSVLIHTWESAQIRALVNVADRFPKATLIMAHSGGTVQGIQEGVAVAKKYENILLDITISSNYMGSVEYMVNHAGADRVLFGSDAVFISQSAALARVLHARISDEEKEKILGLNMKRVLESGGGSAAGART